MGNKPGIHENEMERDVTKPIVIKDEPMEYKYDGNSYTPFIPLNSHTKDQANVDKPTFSSASGAKQKATKQFLCVVCDKLFASKTSLTEHFRIHTGEKPFPCTQCDKCFRTKQQLNQHLKTHMQNQFPPQMGGEQSIPAPLSNVHNFPKPFTIGGYESSQQGSTAQQRKKSLEKEHVTKINLTEPPETSYKESQNVKPMEVTGKIFDCMKCDKVFKTKDDLQKHSMTHTGETRYICSICCEPYWTSYKLHSKQHKPTTSSSSLPSTDKKEILKSDIVIKVEAASPKEAERKKEVLDVVCPLCKDKFDGKIPFLRHVLIHVGEELYNSAPKETELKKNAPMDSIPQSGDPKYECTLCDKYFVGKQELQMHLATHTDIKKYICGICDKGFSSKSKLKKHNMIHADPLSKSESFQKTTAKAELTKLSKMKSSEKSFKCHMCNSGFNELLQLKKHIKNHPEMKPYRCPTCSKGFMRENNFHRHLTMHTVGNMIKPEPSKTTMPGGQVKSHECRICHKAFGIKAHLTMHMEKIHSISTHQMQNNFICRVCNKFYSSKKSLNAHFNSIHMGRKLHKCNICSKSFVSKLNLIKHFQSHLLSSGSHSV